MLMISFLMAESEELLLRKIEEVEKWDGSKGSQSECW